MELRSQRLRIRLLQDTDLGFCFALQNQSAKETAHWLRWTISSYREHNRLNQPPLGELAVELAASKIPIGLIGLAPMLEPFGQLPSFGRTLDCDYTVEIGLYWHILHEHRNNGYATGAAKRLVQHCFEELKLARVFAATDYNNQASICVMNKLGMTIERNPFDSPPWFQVRAHLSKADWLSSSI